MTAADDRREKHPCLQRYQKQTGQKTVVMRRSDKSEDSRFYSLTSSKDEIIITLLKKKIIVQKIYWITAAFIVTVLRISPAHVKLQHKKQLQFCGHVHKGQWLRFIYITQVNSIYKVIFCRFSINKIIVNHSLINWGAGGGRHINWEILLRNDLFKVI